MPDLSRITIRPDQMGGGDIKLIDAHPTGCVVVSPGLFAQHYLR